MSGSSNGDGGCGGGVCLYLWLAHRYGGRGPYQVSGFFRRLGARWDPGLDRCFQGHWPEVVQRDDTFWLAELSEVLDQWWAERGLIRRY
jgi:hypothetical protein